MILPSKDRNFHKRVILYVSEAINILLYAIVGLALIGILLGIIYTARQIMGDLSNESGRMLETLIVNTITILAVIEVIRVILSYLSEGRVRVSLVIDAVLVVMLNEIIREWFEGKPHNTMLYLVAVLIALMALRIAAILYGPSSTEFKKR